MLFLQHNINYVVYFFVRKIIFETYVFIALSHITYKNKNFRYLFDIVYVKIENPTVINHKNNKYHKIP